MKVRIWYEDHIGLTKLEVNKNNLEEAKEYFNTYYRKCKLINIIKIE